MEPKYRIEELSTTGWNDWDETNPDLTKEECQAIYKTIINDGSNPDDLRIKRVSLCMNHRSMIM